MSGRKNVLAPVDLTALCTSADMSGNITSPVTNIQNLDNVSVQITFTGTPTGSFFIDGSLDNINFDALTLSPAPTASGAADTILIDLNQLSFPYIRMRYVATSGTGTLTKYMISGKQV